MATNLDPCVINMDQLSINNFFTHKDIVIATKNNYKEVNEIQVPDQNGGVYNSSTPININTLNIPADSFPLYGESRICIPTSVSSSSATPFTSSQQLAWKQSNIGMISGARISNSAGTTLYDNQNGSLPVKNAIKQLLQMNWDSLKSQGPLNEFYGPHFCSSTGGNVGSVNYPFDTYLGQVTPAINATGANYNQTFAKAVSQFGKNWTWNQSTASFQNVLNYQLRDLCPLFSQLDAPVTNNPLYMYLYTNNANNCPMTAPTGASNQAIPLIQPTLNAVDSQGLTPGNCKLFLKTVKFPDIKLPEVAEALKNGAKKIIEYVDTDMKVASGQILASTTGNVSIQVTNTVVRPTCLWVIATPPSAIARTGNLFPPCADAGCVLSNINISINNAQFYNFPIPDSKAAYNLLKQYMMNSQLFKTDGSLFDYNMWLNGYNIYCFPLDRIKVDPENSACQIIFNSSYTSQNACDLVFVVDKVCTLSLEQFSNSTNASLDYGAHGGRLLAEHLEKQLREEASHVNLQSYPSGAGGP